MAEDTGLGHTLLGTNGLQQSVDKLDSAVNKLDEAADKMSGAANRMSGNGSHPSNGGLWNAASNWMQGKSNGGGVSFNGGGSHRAEGDAQVPKWAGSVGNFAKTMSSGNGGSGWKVGSSLGGIRGGLAGAAAVGLTKAVGYGINNGASASDMYGFNMMGGTATRMYTQGLGNANTGGILYGSAGTADTYQSLYNISANSGFLPNSSGAMRMLNQAGGMTIGNPMSTLSQNVGALMGARSNATVNQMKAYGINTYNRDPNQIAQQLLTRLGVSTSKKYTAAQIQMLTRDPNMGLATTLRGMVSQGVMSQDLADSIQDAGYQILTGASHGYSASQMDKMFQTAARDQGSQAAKDLKKMGFNNSTEQTMRNRAANTTESSQKQLDSFAATLSVTNRLMGQFNTALRSMPLLEKAAGVNSGSGGWGKKAMGLGLLAGGAVVGTVFSETGIGLVGGAAMMGAGANMLEGKGGIGGGDGSIGTDFSEYGALMGGSTLVSSNGSTTTSSSAGSNSTYGGGVPGGGSSALPSNPVGPIHDVAPNGATTGDLAGIPTGKVSPAQAIARIAAQAKNRVALRVGMCQHYVRSAYGIGAGAGDAVGAWNAAKYKHPGDKSPIVGAFVFWGGGHGHVAIYAGGGKVWSPGGPGDLTHWVLCSIDSITKGWHKSYLGWTEDDNGTRVVRPATTQKSGTGHKSSSTTGSGGGGTTTNPEPNTTRGGGTNKQIVQNVAGEYFWDTGKEWSSLVSLINSESGFNNTAQNPTSTAYGMFQFLDSTWKSTGIKKTSDPTLQTFAGLKYIKSRYGDPIHAWDFHKKNNWYDKGAWEIKNDEDARVHKGEMIIPKDPADQIRQVLLQNNTTNAGAKKSTGSDGGLHFHAGSIVIQLTGTDGTAATGRGLAKAFSQQLAQDARIKALMGGTN